MSTAGSLSLLIVDDDDTMRGVLARLFRDHDVCAVASVDDALEALANGRHFDGVLSDVMMPNRTGVDLYRALERVAPLLASRIVFVTGGGATEEICNFLERCGRPVIEKPFDRSELRAVVERCAREVDWALLVGLSSRAYQRVRNR